MNHDRTQLILVWLLIATTVLLVVELVYLAIRLFG